MAKIDKRIEIVRAANVRFSSMGLKSALMIKKVLALHYEHVNVTMVADRGDLEALVLRRPDIVFLGAKRIEDGSDLIWLSEYLDAHGIAYTGSAKLAMELDLNKAEAKLLIQQNLLPTANFFTARPGQYSDLQPLPLQFPLFIKPHNQGGGKGVGPDSIAHDYVSYQNKVQHIYDEFGSFSLVEDYLQGREFSVALLGNASENDVLAMPIELITTPDKSGDRILGQAIKSEDNERAVAISNKLLKQQITDLALSVYKVLGGRDYGRIDIRMDSSGEAHFLEANLLPGIAHNDFISYFTHACEINLGMDYETMILHIIASSLERHRYESVEAQLI
jgi:D-alanine-D-alanine ligase